MNCPVFLQPKLAATTDNSKGTLDTQFRGFNRRRLPAIDRRLLSSQIVLDISQKSSIAVFLESKIAVFASLAKNLIS